MHRSQPSGWRFLSVSTLTDFLTRLLVSVLGQVVGKSLFGTFYDLLGVVGEELAERRPLGPLQRVEQLLDLRGHSAVDRNSCKDEEQAHGHAHARRGRIRRGQNAAR